MDAAYLLLGRLPIFLLVLVGIVLAIVRWKRHSRASLLTVLGLGLFLIQSLTFMFLYSLLPRLHDTGWSYAGINHLYTLAQVCQDFFFACVIILLVAAAFSQRHSQVSNVEARAVIPS